MSFFLGTGLLNWRGKEREGKRRGRREKRRKRQKESVATHGDSRPSLFRFLRRKSRATLIAGQRYKEIARARARVSVCPRVTRDFSKRDVSTWRGKKESEREKDRERKKEKRRKEVWTRSGRSRASLLTDIYCGQKCVRAPINLRIHTEFLIYIFSG